MNAAIEINSEIRYLEGLLHKLRFTHMDAEVKPGYDFSVKCYPCTRELQRGMKRQIEEIIGSGMSVEGFNILGIIEYQYWRVKLNIGSDFKNISIKFDNGVELSTEIPPDGQEKYQRFVANHNECPVYTHVRICAFQEAEFSMELSATGKMFFMDGVYGDRVMYEPKVTIHVTFQYHPLTRRPPK